MKDACPTSFSQIAKAKVTFCILYPDISTNDQEKTLSAATYFICKIKRIMLKNFQVNYLDDFSIVALCSFINANHLTKHFKSNYFQSLFPSVSTTSLVL